MLLIQETQIPIFRTPLVGDMGDRCPSTNARACCVLVDRNETVKFSSVELANTVALASEVHGPAMKRIWWKGGKVGFFDRLYRWKTGPQEQRDPGMMISLASSKTKVSRKTTSHQRKPGDETWSFTERYRGFESPHTSYSFPMLYSFTDSTSRYARWRQDFGGVNLRRLLLQE
jgi:hypothetical protein